MKSKRISLRYGVIFLGLLCSCLTIKLYAQDTITTTNEIKLDTITTIDTTKIMATKKKKYSYWKSLFFGHIDRTFEQKFDVSFVVAPSWSREANVGIGGMASGLYRLDRKDSAMPPSDVMIFANVSLNGFFAVGTKGNNYFKGNRSLLSYEFAFTRKNLDFWGISYDAGNTNPVTRYLRQQLKFNASYRYKIVPNFYVAGVVDFLYSFISKIGNISYLEGQKTSYITTGLGASLQYDSRDFIPNPKKGMFFMLRESIFPKGLGTAERTLFRTTVIADVYQKVWKGGILAFDVFGEFNSNNAPWNMREELGGTMRMRGYYTGRYIDNNMIAVQVELRQHIYKRLGAAAWGGVGMVFPSLNNFKFANPLPTYGIGLRFEVKHNMNLRLDYGFGLRTSGFILSIGESF